MMKKQIALLLTTITIIWLAFTNIGFGISLYMFLSVLANSPAFMFAVILAVADSTTKNWEIRNRPKKLDSVVEGYNTANKRLKQELEMSRRLVVHLAKKANGGTQNG